MQKYDFLESLHVKNIIFAKKIMGNRMAQITLEYDARKPIFSELIKVFLTAGAKKIEKYVPNAETIEAINDARNDAKNCKKKKFNSFEELINDLDN